MVQKINMMMHKMNASGRSDAIPEDSLDS